MPAIVFRVDGTKTTISSRTCRKPFERCDRTSIFLCRFAVLSTQRCKLITQRTYYGNAVICGSCYKSEISSCVRCSKMTLGSVGFRKIGSFHVDDSRKRIAGRCDVSMYAKQSSTLTNKMLSLI